MFRYPYSDNVETILNKTPWLSICIFLLVIFTEATYAQPLLLNELPTGSLGTWADQYIEDGRVLSLDEAQALLSKGEFQQNKRPIPSEGIGAKPQWLHLEFLNPTAATVPMRLVVGTTWTDRIDAYLVQADQPTARWQTGDEFPDAKGLTPGIGYTLTLNFAPGRSDLYLRVESIDPLIFPIEVLTEEEAISQQRLVHYSYGFVFGFLMALSAYNAILFAGLRKRSYLYYALYLTSLIALITCYTGHGSAWLWPDQPQIQRYVILVMMVVYGCSGLLFASRFLALKEHAPRTLQWVQLYAALGLAFIVLSILLGSQLLAARVAFVFTAAFSVCMVYLSIITMKTGQASGRYFLNAALFGMIGSASTTLAVWGWVPFNTLTYHALEFGVIIEATLFALALSYHFNALSDNLEKINILNNALSLEVAERRQAEAALKESEFRWKFAIEGSGDGVWDWNIETDEAQYSKQWKEMLGYNDNDILPTNDEWFSRVHPDDQLYVKKSMHDYLEGRTEIYVVEYRLRCKDDSYKWILGRGMIVSRSEDGKPLRMIGTHTDITERKFLEYELMCQAQVDHLTGLSNRRHFIAQGEIELSRAIRYGTPLSVLMLDIDYFKNVNDTYGHQIGDAVLQVTSKICQDTLRQVDIAGRLGGEEFAVILPETTRKEALDVAERLREAVAKAAVTMPAGLPIHFTVSIGVTSLDDKGTNIDMLLNQADKALYKAKATGRNRVCVG